MRPSGFSFFFLFSFWASFAARFLETYDFEPSRVVSLGGFFGFYFLKFYL